MEEKEFRKIIKEANQIKLSSSEKEKMREGLRVFIQENPVREIVDPRLPLQRSWFLHQLRLSTMPVLTIIAVIALVAGGGTSLAAENALPGDALYKVKVGVNEEVRAVFAVSDEAEAKLAVKLAERRLGEAATLAAQGRLTAEAETEIDSRLEKHIAKFEKRAQRLGEKGKAAAAVAISSELEASLNAHGQVIASAGKPESEGEANVQVKVITPLLTSVEAKLIKVQKTRVDAEGKVFAGAKADVEAAAEGKLKAAQNKIAEVRGYIERTKGSVSASTTAEAEARLRLAEGAVAEGKAKLEADAFAEAFTNFERAHRLAQEAQLLINASKQFKVDLRDGSGKYGGCSVPRPAMPNWFCPDGTVAGPACVNGQWVIKQCPSSIIGTSTEAESKTEANGEGKFWLNFGF